MKKVIRNTIIDAILLIVLGFILIIKPGTALDIVLKVVGVMLILMGTVKIVEFFVKNEKEDRSVLSLIIGIVQAAVGFFLLVKPAVFIAIWYKAAAILIACGAIMSLLRGFKQKKNGYSGATLTLVFSIITLILAVIVFADSVSFAAFYTQLVGVSFIVEGMTLIFASINKG